jgi:hypothetical protein
MKRQKVYLVVAFFLAILSILTIIYKRKDFNKYKNSNDLFTIFAIKDTTNITKIFLANMYGDKVLLSRTIDGWMVDDQKPASKYQISQIFSTLTSIRVAKPVPKKGQETIIKMLAINSTKVELYETKPLFTLFGSKFFTKEKLLKTYFFGDATQDNLGSFALLEGMSEPYIIYKPGFRGYVTPIFSPKPIDWLTRCIFNTKLTRIKDASFIDYENPENSFFIEKSGTRSFALFDSHKNIVLNYDTTLLINMLSEFRERNYEQFLPDIAQSLKDSIIQFNFYKIISVTDVDNQTTSIKLYHLIDEGALYENGNLVQDVYQEFNKDRCYVTINENTDELYTIQFFHFGRQVQPLSYYLKK